MKRALLLFVMACLLFTGCGGKPPASTQSSYPSSAAVSPADSIKQQTSSVKAESDPLKQILQKQTANPIVYFGRFALDGSREAAFAIVAGEDAWQGDVWYITAEGAQKLKNIAFPEENQPDAPCLWSVGDVELFKCEDNAGGSSSTSYAWYIKDGIPVELPWMGMNLYYRGEGQFTTIDDGFDALFTDGMSIGHTYKIYYLYWAGDGLREYGGIPITLQQLLKVKGAQEIIDTIKAAGFTIGEIYYRTNHIININFHKRDSDGTSYDNITLDYKENTVTPVALADSQSDQFGKDSLGDYSFGGTYKAAFSPEIATYPDGFPAG